VELFAIVLGDYGVRVVGRDVPAFAGRVEGRPDERALLVERPATPDLGVQHHRVAARVHAAEEERRVAAVGDRDGDVAGPRLHVLGVQVGYLVGERALLALGEVDRRFELQMWHGQQFGSPAERGSRRVTPLST
jgi:hypothetical protein